MISPQLRSVLNQQLERLHKQFDEIADDMAALHDFLGLDEPEPYTRTLRPKKPSRRNGKVTFAAHVRSALQTFDEPTKARPVAELLESQGIKPKAKAPLIINVSSELARMSERRTGGVTKVGRGLYQVLAPGNGTGVGKPT